MEQLPQPDLLQDFEMDTLQRSATIGQRFINCLLDLVLFYVILTFVGLFLAFGKVIRSAGVENSDFSSDNYQTQFFFITLVVFILFYTIIEGAGKGKSLGKLLTRTRAVKV